MSRDVGTLRHMIRCLVVLSCVSCVISALTCIDTGVAIESGCCDSALYFYLYLHCQQFEDIWCDMMTEYDTRV